MDNSDDWPHKNEVNGQAEKAGPTRDRDTTGERSSGKAARGCAAPRLGGTGRYAPRTEERIVLADGGVTVDYTDLTAFQRDVLRTIAKLTAEKSLTNYGLAIKRSLELEYGEDVNHGRLYPNLDTLVEDGLVEKSELDKRTNEYALTDDGEAVLEEYADTLAEAVADLRDAPQADATVITDGGSR